MQATSSTTARNSFQQSQQENHEDHSAQNSKQENYAGLNTSSTMNEKRGGDNEAPDSGKETTKKPAMVSKPVAIKLEVISSEATKNQTTPMPISPRGIKPIPRLQLPEVVQNPKSPRSPRADQMHNAVENRLQSPGKDEIIKMADSVADAFRVFGSPRKEQPTPRRLESRRDLDKPLTHRPAEKTENSQESTTITTTTTTEPSATLSSATTVTSLSSSIPLSQSDFSASIVPIDNQAIMRIPPRNGIIGTLADESGYQPGQIFVKVRRRISMPKVFAPVSDSAVPPFVQPARTAQYRRQIQIELLADMLVSEYMSDSINPNDMGSISQNTTVLKMDKLPIEFSEFNSYLNGKNKPNSTHLMHAIFRNEFESSVEWKKSIAIDHRYSRSGDDWVLQSENVQRNLSDPLKSTLQIFSDEFSSNLFGSEDVPTLQSIAIPEELKNFLLIVDKKFVGKLLDQTSRAAAGEKGTFQLSMKNIEQLRAYLLVNILVQRFIMPMLLAEDRPDTPISMTLFRLEINAAIKKSIKLCADFQQKSFELFPEKLQVIMIKKSKDELQIASIQRGRDRFLQIKKEYSQRHTRSRSDVGMGTRSDALEEKARIEYQKRNRRKQLDSQRNQINNQLGQILCELKIKEFPVSLGKKIDTVKMNWFSIEDEVNNHAVIDSLLKTTRDLITNEGIDKNLMEFEEKLSSLASESLDSRAKRRATMPLSLGDLDFLNAILDQTIKNDISPEPDVNKASIKDMISTSAMTETKKITTTSAMATTTITTEILNSEATTKQDNLASLSESDTNGMLKNDPSKSTN